MSATDLFIRRAYTYKGVNVLVDIDLTERTVTLVDRQRDGSFKRKQWVFAERELKYMAGWQLILDAMKYAVSEATKVLEEAEKVKEKEFIDLMLSLNNTVEDLKIVQPKRKKK